MNGRRDWSFFLTKKNPAPADDSGSEGLCDVSVHRFSLLARQGVQSAFGRRGAGEKVNGAVVRAMRRKRHGSGLAEDLLEVVIMSRDVGDIWGVLGPGGGRECRECRVKT